MLGRATLMMVLALVLSSIQCVSACVTEDCAPAQNVPPCHQHGAPAQHDSSVCGHQISLADATQSPVTHAGLSGSAVVTAAVLAPVFFSDSALPARNPAPPWSGTRESEVLRV